MKYTHNLLILLSTLTLTSCGGSTSVSSLPLEQETPTTPETAGKLTRSTESSLTTYFHQMSQHPRDDAALIQTSVAASAVEGSSTASSTSISATNVQENGVDEADLIKISNNGRYIYSVDKSTPATDIDTPQILAKINNSDSIRIMDAQNTQLTEVKELLSNNDKRWHINGLYLDDTRDNLVALSSNNNNYWGNWFRSDYFAQQTTDLFFFDISTPSAALLRNTLSFDGSVIDSRRNGDVLYLVLRHFPDYLYNKDNAQENTTAIDILPYYRLNNAEKQPVVLAENCYQEDAGKRSGDIITLVAVNLASDTPEINSQCYVGAAEAIYASQKALYLATTRWNYQSQNGIAEYEDTTTTNIHKFAYNGMEFDYRGSAEVRGHLGHQQNRKSFRFSEHNGFLRIVTFSPAQWPTIAVEDPNFVAPDIATEGSDLNETTPRIATEGPEFAATKSSKFANKSPVSLTILEEDSSTKTLKIVAQLPNEARPEPIGLPEEQLYASRFIGDRAYFVTFRVTDPLYVLDLSTPTDPFIAGELKVDGYSDYLHPLSETLLLGIGKDAIPSTENGDGRGAWYQGVKLSLIDVSDPNNPREADKRIIGKRGTESNALYNHHALTSLQVGDTQRIALPIRLHEQAPFSNTTASASSYYSYTNTGLYQFEVDMTNQTLVEKSAILTNDQQTTSYGDTIQHDRSVMINDVVHYMHNGQFYSQDWDSE